MSTLLFLIAIKNLLAIKNFLTLAESAARVSLLTCDRMKREAQISSRVIV